MEDLTAVVIGRGMAVLGADGGAVAVRVHDELRRCTGARWRRGDRAPRAVDRGGAEAARRDGRAAGRHDLEALRDGLLDQAGLQHDDVAIPALRIHPQDAPRPPEAGLEILPRAQAEARLTSV